MSDSLQPPWLQHTRLPCPPLYPGICSNSCPLSPWCHPTISSSLPLSVPALNLSQHQDLYRWVCSSHQDCHCITRKVPTFVIFDLTCPWPPFFLRGPFLLQQRERDTSNSPAAQDSHSWEFPTRKKQSINSGYFSENPRCVGFLWKRDELSEWWKN